MFLIVEIANIMHNLLDFKNVCILIVVSLRVMRQGRKLHLTSY